MGYIWRYASALIAAALVFTMLFGMTSEAAVISKHDVAAAQSTELNGTAATPTDGIYLDSDFYYYYVSGERVTADGWYRYGENTVSRTLSDSDIIAGREDSGIQYLELSDGHVVTEYHADRCYSYSGINKSVVKNKTVNVSGVDIRYDIDGNLFEGYATKGGELYCYETGIAVKNRLIATGKTYYYFGADGKAIKNRWCMIDNVDYYMDADGYASTKFFRSAYGNSKYAGKLYYYSGGKWKNSGDGIKKINGECYLFEKGAVYTKTKWYVKTEDCRYYVTGGTVKYKLVSQGIRYKAYTFSNGKWVSAGSRWFASYNNHVIHTDEDGISDAIYYKTTNKNKSYAGTYREYDSVDWAVKKNSVVYVPGGYYYFDKKGVLNKAKGWKTISSTSAAYVSEGGKVTTYVYYDKDSGHSVYKSGSTLSQAVTGLKKTLINKKAVYYYIGENGVCLADSTITIEGVTYKFDKYGRCIKTDGMTWDYDVWMKRVLKKYLGTTGTHCNEFVANALRYAGGSDASTEMTVRYKSYSSGGIVINSGNSCSYWATGKVTAKAVVSDGESWQKSKTYELTKGRVSFSYSALQPGDIIVYYLNGEPNHVGIYLGKYDTAAALKVYLKKLGVSSAACDSYVHDWGSDSGNKPQYWILQGGMGSSKQVYISNSAYNLSGQIAKKIIHVRY